mmetsp:Transcript_25447/g.46828  ORF Transcript_25447/g.46828 Transcript_25447/m.46828 type:complete len:565 (-) Transcript_25447:23-1717(-)
MKMAAVHATSPEVNLILKTWSVDLPRQTGLQEQFANLQQKSRSVEEKAQALEQKLAMFEQVQERRTRAPAVDSQVEGSTANLEHFSINIGALQKKAVALEQNLVMFEQVQERGAQAPALELLVEGLTGDMEKKALTLEQMVARLEQVRRRQNGEPAKAPSALLDDWKTNGGVPPLSGRRDLLQGYQEAARARVAELEAGHTLLQEQVEALTKRGSWLQEQVETQQESIRSLSKAADAAKCRELELQEALLQARREVQQLQEQHQAAHDSAQTFQARYKNAMLELQQSQSAAQQAAQEADTHRRELQDAQSAAQQAAQEADTHHQELLLNKVELLQIGALNTKVTELENLLAEKQYEVDRLKQQLRETQTGKVSKETAPPKRELTGSLSNTPRTTIRGVPAKETASPSRSPVRAVTTDRAVSSSFPRAPPQMATATTLMSPSAVNPSSSISSQRTSKGSIEGKVLPVSSRASSPTQFVYPISPAARGSGTPPLMSRLVSGAVGTASGSVALPIALGISPPGSAAIPMSPGISRPGSGRAIIGGYRTAAPGTVAAQSPVPAYVCRV